MLDVFCNHAFAARKKRITHQLLKAGSGRWRMFTLDFVVIGFGSFVALVVLGMVVLLAANRH